MTPTAICQPDDWNGNLTTYVNDSTASRRRSRGRQHAAGADDSDHHNATFHLPVKIVEPASRSISHTIPAATR